MALSGYEQEAANECATYMVRTQDQHSIDGMAEAKSENLNGQPRQETE
jgi:hypothetical protein